MDILTVQSLCAMYNIHPSKKLGQNFLIDPQILRVILDTADLKANDRVVEVGPGFGVLTQELAKSAGEVLSVEVDGKMYQAATEILTEYKNIKLVHNDILNISNQELFETLSDVQAAAQHSVSRKAQHSACATPSDVQCDAQHSVLALYKVVANLPYSITSAVLRKFTEEEPRPSLIVVMVQKEVAERVCAKPGEMSILSVAIQYYGKPEIVKIVPRSAFWPVPDVDSAILKIEMRGGSTSVATEVEPPGFEKRLFQLVKIGFSSRRKQLRNNLMAGLRIPREQIVKALETAGLEPMVRAQELSVAKWVELARSLY